MGYIDTRLLPREGVLHVPGIFAPERIQSLRDSAVAVLEAVASFSYSQRATALPESQDLLAEIDACGLPERFAEVMGGPVACDLNESWLRKRFAPAHAPRFYQPNSWHQDGGLGVAFTPDPSAEVPMTRLLTCWIPLDDCGRDRPGLEFVRGRLDSLLHYTELEDQRLRRRFAPECFWAPELRVGDALVFLDSCLHRTYVRPEMTEDRLSMEYRFFPTNSAPITMEA